MNSVFNFKNVGEKIKKYAKWVCWISIVLLWIFSLISIIIVSNNITSFSGNFLYILITFILSLLGSFLIWIGSWFAYAFGDLVDNVACLRKQFCPKEEEEEEFFCPCCGGKNFYEATKCSHCGQSFEWEE
ncbi:MAG: hypothetical protein IJO00_00055 [Clostridia bacterium]|nr:hypothetical protein [Clostridia bacterium]